MNICLPIDLTFTSGLWWLVIRFNPTCSEIAAIIFDWRQGPNEASRDYSTSSSVSGHLRLDSSRSPLLRAPLLGVCDGIPQVSYWI